MNIKCNLTLIFVFCTFHSFFFILKKKKNAFDFFVLMTVLLKGRTPVNSDDGVRISHEKTYDLRLNLMCSCVFVFLVFSAGVVKVGRELLGCAWVEATRVAIFAGGKPPHPPSPIGETTEIDIWHMDSNKWETKQLSVERKKVEAVTAGAIVLMAGGEIG